VHYEYHKDEGENYKTDEINGVNEGSSWRNKDASYGAKWDREGFWTDEDI
jgi:hypothetical protein